MTVKMSIARIGEHVFKNTDVKAVSIHHHKIINQLRSKVTLQSLPPPPPPPPPAPPSNNKLKSSPHSPHANSHLLSLPKRPPVPANRWQRKKKKTVDSIHTNTERGRDRRRGTRIINASSNECTLYGPRVSYCQVNGSNCASTRVISGGGPGEP